jgi:hypothetical protein
LFEEFSNAKREPIILVNEFFFLNYKAINALNDLPNRLLTFSDTEGPKVLIQMLSTGRISDESMEVLASRICYILVSVISFKVGKVIFAANEMGIFMEEVLYAEGVGNVPHLAYVNDRPGGHDQR